MVYLDLFVREMKLIEWNEIHTHRVEEDRRYTEVKSCFLRCLYVHTS